METKNSSGRAVAVMIGIWCIIKAFLNCIIDGINLFSIPADIGNFIIAIAVTVVAYLGIKYTNYVIAAVLAITVLVNLFSNIKGLFSFDSMISSLLYLGEGAVDIICALILCMSENVKEHFSNGLSGK